MGCWDIDCNTQAKQLTLWLKKLIAHYQDEYDKVSQNDETKKEEEQEEQEDQEENDAPEEKEEAQDNEDELKDEPNITCLFISNCLFLNSEYQLITRFRKLFKKSVRHARFYDESKHAEIVQQINNWTAKHTLSKAPMIGSQLQLIEATAIGISALYFHGIFWYSFDPSNTKTLPFFSDSTLSRQLKSAPFINGITKCRYYNGKKYGTDWTFVCLDYHLKKTDLLERLSLIFVKRIPKKTEKKDKEHICRKPIR
ncbi:serine protease inhibitor [Reticulomyxa filosa]|uniref:Serine protease inhibitor n=1 Tax=Reticulomyxa filosa TaxID=46433 RepID=X6P5Q1_RETFI|nr:serine protease inhibitor [Reticulomyxa filosa]|eukprot:ETO33404.1 serine protease inhibitor [Reticulomyxa filosa]